MVAVGGDIFVFGGKTDLGVRFSNDFFRISTTTLQWEQLNATQVSGIPPGPRIGENMVAVGGDLYVFESWTGSSEEKGAVNDFSRFSTTALRWEQLDAPPLPGFPPSPRMGHSVSATGGDLYVFGGATDRTSNYDPVLSNELFRFSTTALRWEHLDATQVSGSPPIPRYGHAMVALGVDLFIFGGDADSGEKGQCG